jgi:hypothetical protein
VLRLPIGAFLYPTPLPRRLSYRILSQSQPHPSTRLRRRPLNCGSVPRLCRYTGVIPSFPRLLITIANPSQWTTIPSLQFLSAPIYKPPRHRHASQFFIDLYLCQVASSSTPPSIPSTHHPCPRMTSDQRHTYDPLPLPVLQLHYNLLSPFRRSPTLIVEMAARSEHCMFARVPADGSTASVGSERM